MGVCSSTPSDRSQLAAAEKQAQQLRSLLTAADARIHQLQGLLAANGVPHGMQAQSKVPALMHQSSDIAAARDSHAMANAGLLTHHAVNLNMQQPSAQQQQRSYQQAYMQPAPQPQPQPMPQPAPVYQPPPPASSNVHKRAVSTASVYDDQDLDDEWAALLNDVDAILVRCAGLLACLGSRQS